MMAMEVGAEVEQPSELPGGLMKAQAAGPEFLMQQVWGGEFQYDAAGPGTTLCDPPCNGVQWGHGGQSICPKLEVEKTSQRWGFFS